MAKRPPYFPGGKEMARLYGAEEYFNTIV